MKNSNIYYSVGALLYCPANNKKILHSLLTEHLGRHYSLALCLEDTISDKFVEEAEDILIDTITSLNNHSINEDFFIPKIFIRVRNADQIHTLLIKLGAAEKLVTGFIIPKFSIENMDEYINMMISVNKEFKRTIYMMPILESPTIINLKTRYSILYTLKSRLDSIEELVLNIRVGGNDLSHSFGFRRHADESIYDLKPIANIFSDIITVFGMDYVISGPVWEYYSGNSWDTGLINELKQDRLCGFTGKTVIHPSQIELVHNAYQVSKEDYEDAQAILSWDKDSNSLVHGSTARERMNEYKTHYNWAATIMALSQIYGISEANNN